MRIATKGRRGQKKSECSRVTRVEAGIERGEEGSHPSHPEDGPSLELLHLYELSFFRGGKGQPLLPIRLALLVSVQGWAARDEVVWVW